jgi:nitroreductase
MMNETIKNIMDRRSIRSFKPEPLTPAQLDVLRDAALASPTGMNRQPWQFHFILNPAVIARVSQAAMDAFRRAGNQAVVDRIEARNASLFYGAPLLVIITAPADNLASLDVGIATENIVLAAQSIGLGSCIIGLADAAFGGEDAQELSELIQMPAGNKFAISIAVGHPAMTKEAHEIHPDKITWIR